MEPTHDYIIEAKEVYIQLYFGKYKRKLVLRNSPSVYISSTTRVLTLNFHVAEKIFFHDICPHQIHL